MGRGKLQFTISARLLVLLCFSYSWSSLSQSTIRYLPGFPGPLPFHLETGYIGVGELEEDQLFYYFVESERDPKEDPLVLWLTGGPGCSAWSGLVNEVGPLIFENVILKRSIPTLELRQHGWTKVSSIVFVDAPVGTGFSYSTGLKDDEIGDFRSSKEAHEFLRKWLMDHPQFISNPLYIGGDSYSGVIVPIIVQEIANGIEAGQEPILNLKGYFLGNPVTDRTFDGPAVVPYAHGMGLISDELYESTKKNCGEDYYTKPSSLECIKDLEAVNVSIASLDSAQILEPRCPFASPKQRISVGHRRSVEEKSEELLLPYPLPWYGCREYTYLLSDYWANNESVRETLKIRKGTVGEWRRCNYGIHYKKEVLSTIKYHLNLTTKGYRALIYSGDHDLVVTFVGTQAWIRSLNFPIVDDWRPWFIDGQVGGYTRAYSNNLTFATVKGAGHTAPEYKPKEALAMFQRWISHKPL